jgi:predicted O-methyltransferase YrrM
MITPRALVKSFISLIWKLKAKRTASRLSRYEEVYPKLIGETLTDVLSHNVSKEEEEWINKIHSLRKKLELSDEKIELVDFGAILPDSNISEQELKAGKTVISTVGAKCKSCSELFFWVFILFKLIRKFKPTSCLELGTCMGLSASLQASALKLNGKGRMITMEGSPSLACIANKNFQSLNLDNIEVKVGRFQDTLPEILKQHGPFDYVFIDGHLDGTATVNNFNQIIPFVADKALFIVDNISWSESMKRGWKSIEANERIKITFHLRQMGICIIDNDIKEKQSYSIPLL